MTIATYKNALKSWVETQTGLTAQWRDEQGVWQPKTRARLHLSDFDGVGVGYTRWEVDAELEAGQDLVPTFSQDGVLTVSIIITSRNQDGSNIAASYLRKLRVSLRKPSVRSALRAAGLAHATTEPTVDLSSLVDDRVESQAQMDVHFNVAYNERDEAEADSYVETWAITSSLTDQDGDAHHDDGEESYP